MERAFGCGAENCVSGFRIARIVLVSKTEYQAVMQLGTDREIRQVYRGRDVDSLMEILLCRWIGLKRLRRAKGTTAALQII